jgi:hypothetical protein
VALAANVEEDVYVDYADIKAIFDYVVNKINVLIEENETHV